MSNLDSILKSRDIYLPTKVCLIKARIFPSSHVYMWELDYKERWVLNIWCFWTVVLEKTLESPLDCKEIQSVNPKGNQSWMFIERTDAKAKNQYFGLLMRRTTYWKRLWCWERLKAGGEGDDRGWDGCIASLTWWTRVWVNSGSWWWTGEPGLLHSKESKESDTTELLGWNRNIYIYIHTHTYKFSLSIIHQQTLRLLPCLGYYK